MFRSKLIKLKLSACFIYSFNPEPIVFQIKKIGIKPKKKYRYELVEKILIKLPKRYRNKSYIILDGKFVCVDPFLNTNYHLLSDNKNSEIEISRGFFPKFKNIKKKYLTKGFLKNKKNSNFRKFINISTKQCLI